ncbi:MAG: hypothetical protein ACRBBN_11775 [Methyloligellaceae bacterium]
MAAGKSKYAQVNIENGNSKIANKICDAMKEEFGDAFQSSFGTDYDIIYITLADGIAIDASLKKVLSDNQIELVWEKTDEEIHLGLGGPLTSRKGHFYRVKVN